MSFDKSVQGLGIGIEILSLIWAIRKLVLTNHVSSNPTPLIATHKFITKFRQCIATPKISIRILDSVTRRLKPRKISMPRLPSFASYGRPIWSHRRGIIFFLSYSALRNREKTLQLTTYPVIRQSCRGDRNFLTVRTDDNHDIVLKSSHLSGLIISRPDV